MPDYKPKQHKYADRRYLRDAPKVVHVHAVEAWAVKEFSGSKLRTAYFNVGSAQKATQDLQGRHEDAHYIRIMVMKCEDGKWRRIMQDPIALQDRAPDLDHVNAYKRANQLWDDYLSTLLVGEMIPPDTVLQMVQDLVNTGVKEDCLAASQVLQLYAGHYRI